MWGPLIIALLYFVILIGLANYFLHSKVKTMVDFSMGGQALSWGLVTLSLALIPHGSGHTMSLWESSARIASLHHLQSIPVIPIFICVFNFVV